MDKDRGGGQSSSGAPRECGRTWVLTSGTQRFGVAAGVWLIVLLCSLSIWLTVLPVALAFAELTASGAARRPLPVRMWSVLTWLTASAAGVWAATSGADVVLASVIGWALGGLLTLLPIVRLRDDRLLNVGLGYLRVDRSEILGVERRRVGRRTFVAIRTGPGPSAADFLELPFVVEPRRSSARTAAGVESQLDQCYCNHRGDDR